MQDEKAQREAVIAQILALFYAAYGRDPLQGMEKNIKVAAWRMALSDVPISQLMPLAESELQNRTNKFLPVPADLLARWKGEETVTDEDGKQEKVTRANAAMYQPLQPTENEAAYMAQPDAKALPVSPEHTEPQENGRIAGICYCDECEATRAKMKRGTARKLVSVKELPRMKPTDERTLAMALCEYLQMEVWRVPREVWMAYGWWLLSQYPVEKWTPELGREQWAEYQKEQVTQ